MPTRPGLGALFQADHLIHIIAATNSLSMTTLRELHLEWYRATTTVLKTGLLARMTTVWVLSCTLLPAPVLFVPWVFRMAGELAGMSTVQSGGARLLAPTLWETCADGIVI